MNDNSTGATALIYSSRSFSDTGRSWGGARNSASRVSDTIRLTAALSYVDAVRWAIEAGMPFNRHLTVHWQLCDVGDHQAALATTRLMKLIRDWAIKRGGRFAYVWTRETVWSKGTHVHILLHLAKGEKLGAMPRRWVRQIAGRAPKNAVRTKSISRSTSAAFSASDAYQADLATLVAYHLKGLDETSARALGLDKCEQGGRIIGKRMSISQNLRPKVRGRPNPSNDNSGERVQSAS